MPRNLLILLAMALLGVLGPAAGDLFAQTLLRWKLAAGEKLQVAVTQKTSSHVAFSGKEARTEIDLTMDLTWEVLAADAKEIRLAQSIQRVRFKLNSSPAGTIEFDTAAQAKPIGQAREIAAAVQPLLGARIELTMNDRGEVEGTKPLGTEAEKLFAPTAEGEPPGAFSKQAIQQLLRQPLAILPEKAVAQGDMWTTKNVIAPAAGKFNQEITYTLADDVERDGQKLARIDSTATLTPVPPAAGETVGKLTLKANSQTGMILFSTASGRVVEARQTQKLTTERPYRETTIVVTLASEQTTTIQPAK